MKRITVFILAIMCFALPFVTVAQCDNSLVEMAIDNLANDKVFIREFKAKLDRSTARNPEPVAKYNVYLQEGIEYFFSVLGAGENESRAIVQLYKKDRLLKSNMDFDTRDIKGNFMFSCEETGLYRVYISFEGGKNGCAVATLSMLVDEEGRAEEKPEPEYEILFKGLETPVSVYTDAPDSFKVIHDISMGSLYKKGGEFYIMVPDTGLVEVKTTVKNTTNEMVEETVTRFRVVEVQKPAVVFHNSRGGMINKMDILQDDRLYIAGVPEAYVPYYEIIEFKVSTEFRGFDSSKSFDDRLTYQQYNMIKGLKEGQKFYIYDIMVKGPMDVVYKAEPLGFILY